LFICRLLQIFATGLAKTVFSTEGVRCCVPENCLPMFLQRADGQGRGKGNNQISHLVLPPAGYQQSCEIKKARLCLRLQGPRVKHPGQLGD
jgi:hypothetical protein